MSTTGTVNTADVFSAAMIVLTETELGAHVTHAPTRRWLTGPGLPGVGGLLTFEALRRDGLRTVADSTGDQESRLSPELRDQLVIGGLLGAQGPETESVLLDGSTGEISTTYFLHGRPDLMDRRPFAPSLEKLVRFATAADELAALRGQFAAYAGRFGPQAVAEASQQLLALYEEGTGGDVAPFWKMAAVIRPLALVAGRGTVSELALDLPPRLLDDEFGSGAVVRFEDLDFPPALSHEPTRRFLREVGLPEEVVWFTLDTDLPLPTLAEYAAEADLADAHLPDGADRLIRLGHLLEDTSLVIDGTTGAVLCWSEPDATLRPLNADISTLAFTFWLIRREQTLDAEHDLTEAYEQLADTMTRTLAAVDPIACSATPATPQDDGWRYWPGVFEDQAGGGLYA
ncbi:SUKH-4 family immunity protein [Streptomyces griseus]|uniref:SUKH-4 family immunity protein n=1 Tax=Streptomyces griseus TaxID=1911 RepID=UPI0005651D2F|nr:SUKH-4 family immunity protein [Streptomyces griseus]